MGTQFFKGAGKAQPVTGSNTNQLARALNSGQYGARSAGIGAQKNLASVAAINKAVPHGPLKRSAAYPKGPKI